MTGSAPADSPPSFGALRARAFVQRRYAQAGITLAPGISAENTTSHDIAGTAVPHQVHHLLRSAGAHA